LSSCDYKEEFLNEHDLFIKLKFSNSTKIRDYIAKCNDGLVGLIVRKMIRDNNANDLMQEGRIGLLIAIDRFDPNKKTKNGNYVRFSTYATYYIKMMLKKYYKEKHYMIRKSHYIYSIRNKKELTKRQEKLINYSEIKRKYINDIVDNNEIKIEVNLDGLDDLEKYIIIHQYKLYGNEYKNQRKIAEEVGCNKKYIREVQEMALIKLRTLNR
jgi:RNA polymerase sigma factor (sigma-70 family)